MYLRRSVRLFMCAGAFVVNTRVDPAIKLFAHFSLLLFFFLDILIYGTLPWFNSVLLANVENNNLRDIGSDKNVDHCQQMVHELLFSYFSTSIYVFNTII